MTPMPLERALEVALAVLDPGTEEQATYEELDQAAATLRAFMEKGLPLYRAAEDYQKRADAFDNTAALCLDEMAEHYPRQGGQVSELKPCPFCGGRPNIDRWVNLTKNGVVYCAACDFTLPPTAWNRRTPDLTEALARLKALEEAIGRYGRYPGIEWCDDWKNEIAAIRGKLGGE